MGFGVSHSAKLRAGGHEISVDEAYLIDAIVASHSGMGRINSAIALPLAQVYLKTIDANASWTLSAIELTRVLFSRLAKKNGDEKDLKETLTLFKECANLVFIRCKEKPNLIKNLDANAADGLALTVGDLTPTSRKSRNYFIEGASFFAKKADMVYRGEVIKSGNLMLPVSSQTRLRLFPKKRTFIGNIFRISDIKGSRRRLFMLRCAHLANTFLP